MHWTKLRLQRLIDSINSFVNPEQFLISIDIGSIRQQRSLRIVVNPHPYASPWADVGSEAMCRFYSSLIKKFVLPYYWLPTLRSETSKQLLIKRTEEDAANLLKVGKMKPGRSHIIQLTNSITISVIFYPKENEDPEFLAEREFLQANNASST